MQAIQTKYIGPSNVRGSRIKATASAGSVTLHWDDSLNSDANHRAAAMALATKYEWDGTYVSGGLDDGSMVWVNIDWNDERSKFTVKRVAS